MKEYAIATGVVQNDCGIVLTSHLLGNTAEGRALARLTARKQCLTMKLPALNGLARPGFGYEGHYPRTVRVYRITIVRENGFINLNKSPCQMIWHVSLMSPWHCAYKSRYGKTAKAPKKWNMTLPRPTPTTKETL